MVWDTLDNRETATKAGYICLWSLARKMTTLAIGWRLMVLLSAAEMGTPGVESQAKQRRIERKLKLGNQRILEMKDSLVGERSHVSKLKKIRVEETKSNWSDAKEKYK